MPLEYVFGYIYILEERPNHIISVNALSKEDVVEHLKYLTDEDFGYDAEAWRNYFKQYDLWTDEGLKAAIKGKIKRAKEKAQEDGKQKGVDGDFKSNEE